VSEAGEDAAEEAAPGPREAREGAQLPVPMEGPAWRVDLRGSVNHQLTASAAALAAANAQAPWAQYFSGEDDCPKIRAAIRALEAEIAENGCAEEKQALDAALANLERVEAEVEAERARRQRLRAKAKAAGAEYRDALGALAAANAQLAQAQRAYAAAQQAIVDAFAAHFGWPPGENPFTGAPPEGADDYVGVPLGGGVSVAFHDPSGHIDDIRRPRLIDRMKDDLRYDIPGGRKLMAAAEAAKAALDDARQALEEAKEAERKAGEAFREADAEAHHLPPLEAPLSKAEARVEAARTAYEDCKEAQAARRARLAELKQALADCEERAEAQRELEEARAEADRLREEAEAALEELRRAIRELEEALANAPPGAAREEAEAELDRLRALLAELKQALDDLEGGEGLQAAGQGAKSGAGLDGPERIREEARRIRERLKRRLEDIAARARGAAADAAGTKDVLVTEAERARAKAERVRRANEAFERAKRRIRERGRRLDDGGAAADPEAARAFRLLNGILDGLEALDLASQGLVEMDQNIRAFYRALRAFLNAVLTAGGDARFCSAEAHALIQASAGLSGHDAVRGLAAMLHGERQLCEAFLRAARNDRNRALIRAMWLHLARLGA